MNILDFFGEFARVSASIYDGSTWRVSGMREWKLNGFSMIGVVSTGLLLAAAPVARAADGAAIAKANNCMTCHGVDTRKMMGPSFKEIANRYKGKNVEAVMVEKIKKGSAGEWGAMAMPAQPQLSDADARVIAKWILAR